jgi:hypothetical protein
MILAKPEADLVILKKPKKIKWLRNHIKGDQDLENPPTKHYENDKRRRRRLQ